MKMCRPVIRRDAFTATTPRYTAAAETEHDAIGRQDDAQRPTGHDQSYTIV